MQMKYDDCLKIIPVGWLGGQKKKRDNDIMV